MTTISEINNDTWEDVNVIGTITEMSGPRDITCNKGTKKEYETKILEINIEDDTGSIWVDVWRPKIDLDIGDEVEILNGYTRFNDYKNEYRLGFAPKKGGSIVNRSTKPKKSGGKKKPGSKKKAGSTSKASGGASNGGSSKKNGGSMSTADTKALKTYINKKIKNLDESLSESIAGVFVKVEELVELVDNIAILAGNMMRQQKIIVKHYGIAEPEGGEIEEEYMPEDDDETELEVESDEEDEPEDDEAEDEETEDDTETDDE